MQSCGSSSQRMYCWVSDALLHVGDAERGVVHEVRLAKGVGGAGQKAMRTMADSCERTELREVKQQLRQQQDIFIAAKDKMARHLQLWRRGPCCLQRHPIMKMHLCDEKKEVQRMNHQTVRTLEFHVEVRGSAFMTFREYSQAMRDSGTNERAPLV